MMETKQVIVIRKDLKMRRGKEIAQGCHASMAVLTNALRNKEWGLLEGIPHGYPQFTTVSKRELLEDVQDPVFTWFTNSYAKIAVCCDSEQELIELYEKAKEAKLPCALITDDGRTEFARIPTRTCIAIGPAKSEDIDKITGHLTLR